MAILLGIYINLFDASEQNGPYFEDHMIKRNFLKIYFEWNATDVSSKDRNDSKSQ